MKKGKDIRVYKQITSGQTTSWEAVAAATSCDVETDIELQEVASATTGTWREYRTKRKGWRVTISRLVKNSDTPGDCVLNIGETYVVTIGSLSGTSAATGNVGGSAIVTNARLDAQNGALAKGSWTLTGSGELAAQPAPQIQVEEPVIDPHTILEP